MRRNIQLEWGTCQVYFHTHAITWLPGTKSPTLEEDREKNESEIRQAILLPCYEVSQVNLTLHSISAGVLRAFFKKLPLNCMKADLLYSHLVFYSSFSPSLPYPSLKDCSGEYTGSIKPFWPEIPLLINHLPGLLISAATPQCKEYGVVCAAEGSGYYKSNEEYIAEDDILWRTLYHKSKK